MYQKLLIMVMTLVIMIIEHFKSASFSVLLVFLLVAIRSSTNVMQFKSHILFPRISYPESIRIHRLFDWLKSWPQIRVVNTFIAIIETVDGAPLLQIRRTLSNYVQMWHFWENYTRVRRSYFQSMHVSSTQRRLINWTFGSFGTGNPPSNLVALNGYW